MADNQILIPALPVASALNDADLVVIAQAGIAKTATGALTRAGTVLNSNELGFDYPVTGPAAGTIIVVFNNRNIGTILGADARMVVGSCTATWRIADQGGANPVSITGLASLSVTTTLREDTASALNVMLKTGAADRELQLVLASVTGAGPLLTAVRYTRS